MMESKDPSFTDVSLTTNSMSSTQHQGAPAAVDTTAASPAQQAPAAGDTPTPLPRQTSGQPADAAGAEAAAVPQTRDPTSYAAYAAYKRKSGDFYSSADGVFERAVKDIEANTYDRETDGEFLGAWLLLEVDHWDNETEKIVLLTENYILTVRYDFVPMKVYKFKRQALKNIDTVQMGDFKYPEKSLLNFSSDMRKRSCGGVRLLWNKGVKPTMTQSWSPKSDSMPWQTFTFHPLCFTEKGQDNVHYDVQNFTQAATDAINQAYAKHNPGQTLVIKEEPLMQEIYVGLPSQVHNQSFLGMSKERGGVSF